VTTFIFVHVFHLKFTINADFVHIPVEAIFSSSTVCRNHYGQYLRREWYIVLFIVSRLRSQLSSLTEHTSDNQLRTSLITNDVLQVATYQIVTFLVENKML